MLHTQKHNNDLRHAYNEANGVHTNPGAQAKRRRMMPQICNGNRTGSMNFFSLLQRTGMIASRKEKVLLHSEHASKEKGRNEGDWKTEEIEERKKSMHARGSWDDGGSGYSGGGCAGKKHGTWEIGKQKRSIL